MNPLLEPYAHPGKYEGELNLAERLDGESPDEEIGDVETFGYYALFLGLTVEEFGDLGDIRAAILHTGSQGFVTAAYYDSDAEARAEWDRIEGEWIADMADDTE